MAMGFGAKPDLVQDHQVRSPTPASRAASLQVSNSATIAAGPAVDVVSGVRLGVAIRHPLGPLPRVRGLLGRFDRQGFLNRYRVEQVAFARPQTGHVARVCLVPQPRLRYPKPPGHAG
jgi:hypothetical protein